LKYIKKIKNKVMKIEKRVSEKKRGRGRPSKASQMKNVTPLPSLIDFKNLTKLNNLEIDARMLESMPTGIRQVDELFSFEGGIPCATNIMAIGDPGVGKTSMLLDILASSILEQLQRYLLQIIWSTIQRI
jgi:predicted ATP-dependent serine protease